MKHLPLLCLLLLAACGRDPQPSANAAATVAPTEEEAAQATYGSDYTENGALKLVDGHYEDDDQGIADLDALTAEGDLDGDGRNERVVLLVSSAGGTGVFRDIYVLKRDAAGKLSVTGPGFLGDRVDVNDLRVEHGEIVVDLIVQGENDPLCCPTQPVTYRFRLANGKLAEVSGQQRVYLKQ